MEDYSVIYDTNNYENIHYSFKAEGIEKAWDKALDLVSGRIKTVLPLNKQGCPIVADYEDIEYCLHPTEQNSKTKQGWVEVNGIVYYIHKHWSHVGPWYPCWVSEKLNGHIGSIINDNGEAKFISNEKG